MTNIGDHLQVLSPTTALDAPLMSTDEATGLGQLITITTAPQLTLTPASLNLHTAVADLIVTIQAAPITGHGVLHLHQVPANVGPLANDTTPQALPQHPVHPAMDITTDTVAVGTVPPARTGRTKNLSAGCHLSLNA